MKLKWNSILLSLDSIICSSALDGSVSKQMYYLYAGTNYGLKLILVNHLASDNIQISVFYKILSLWSIKWHFKCL